jgi:NAD-dependent SIR2 family protein deacetylase
MQLTDAIPAAITSRTPNAPVPVLDAAQAATLNPAGFVERIIWGWKRDSPDPALSRLVYFGGRHVLDSTGTWIDNPFLFYAHWGDAAALAPLAAAVREPLPPGPFAATTDFEVIPTGPDRVLVRILSGRPTPEDLDRLRRLAARQPDETPPTPPQVPSSTEFNLRASGITGCDLLAGSGLSYEAGLPMLKEIHDLFWVDDGYTDFCLGARDQLPRLLHADLAGMFRRFADWHIQAARTEPSAAHQSLFHLRQAGFLHHVFTDNIDKLFDLAGMPDYTQVRGSGVVNEFYPATFHPASNALLVVGVSADRRGIIAQARQHGLRLVVVNPYIPVSPGAKNLDYLREGDIYFHLSAGEALPRLAACTLAESTITPVGAAAPDPGAHT